MLGASVMALVEVIRDLGTSSYLVQQQDLPVEKTRTAFTIVLGLTLAAAALVLTSVEFIASYYALPGLKNYLQVSLIGFLLGPFVSPIHALLRRDLRFGAISIINVTTSVLNAAVIVLLATLGFSYMSFAWANVASGITGLSLLLFFRPDLSIFRPSFGALRSVVSFGAYDSFAKSLAIAGDYIPNLIFGRILTVEAVGLYQRAGTVCRLPERIFLAGINTAILPIFARPRSGGAGPERGLLAGNRAGDGPFVACLADAHSVCLHVCPDNARGAMAGYCFARADHDGCAAVRLLGDPRLCGDTGSRGGTVHCAADACAGGELAGRGRVHGRLWIARGCAWVSLHHRIQRCSCPYACCAHCLASHGESLSKPFARASW